LKTENARSVTATVILGSSCLGVASVTVVSPLDSLSLPRVLIFRFSSLLLNVDCSSEPHCIWLSVAALFPFGPFAAFSASLLAVSAILSSLAALTA